MLGVGVLGVGFGVGWLGSVVRWLGSWFLSIVLFSFSVFFVLGFNC